MGRVPENTSKFATNDGFGCSGRYYSMKHAYTSEMTLEERRYEDGTPYGY